MCRIPCIGGELIDHNFFCNNHCTYFDSMNELCNKGNKVHSYNYTKHFKTPKKVIYKCFILQTTTFPFVLRSV